MLGMKLRKAASETKMEKERKNIERASKSRSVHFDGNGNNGDSDILRDLEPISIIGRELQSTSAEEDVAAAGDGIDLDAEEGSDSGMNTGNGTVSAGEGFSSGNDDAPPPPPPGRRKVIVAQRQQSFINSLKVLSSYSLT